MTAQTIVNLAKALEVTTDYILTGNNDAPTSKILKNLENLPSDTLNIAEKFLEIFTEGAQSYKNKKNQKKIISAA